jgi:glyoxylase-like metal-dependent hydrolase (beta-lactamase superfamily II)
MKIEKVVVGNLRCNCYVLSINDEVLVIDPGDDGDKIIKLIGNRKVLGIIITHYHFDHIGAVNDLKAKYNAIVYDKSNLCEGINEIGKFKFEVIYTPGHKDDLITVYFKEDKVMFCGDFIFRDSIGRCDLDDGSISDMITSINKIKKYDKDVIVYPGHGDITTLGYEINNNPYFKNYL